MQASSRLTRGVHPTQSAWSVSSPVWKRALQCSFKQTRDFTMALPKTDYKAYTHAELVQRVSDLESQLRLLTIQRQPSPSSPKRKPKKPPKPFDPSRYHTRLIALKFAYLGKNYNGYEHHTNNLTPLPTIEETLWRALMKTKLILPVFKDDQSRDEINWDGTDYSKCGRTDKGVSAFGQVVGIRVRSNRPKSSPPRTEEGTEVAERY
nr:trna pseudouridine(38/39) synthase [Quercus suber]